MTRPTREALRNNPYSAPTVQYPLNLGAEGQEPYIIFDVRDAVARGAASKETIALFLPPTIQVGYGTVWQEVDLGTKKFQALYRSLESGNAFGEISSTAQQAISNILAGITGSSDETLEAGYLTGKVLNPHSSLLFQSVSLREFKFDFQLMARSPEESEAIRQIIYKFKYYSLPGVQADGKAGSRWLTYPENFVISMRTPASDQLFKISTCACNNVTVDYTGSGGNSFFQFTGAPVNVKLSLAFKELEIMRKERIKEGY